MIFAKNKCEHLVLCELALQILSETPRLHDEYVFPSESMDKPLPSDGFSQALTRLLAQTSIEKFTPRDLRRTWKTLGGKTGLSKEIRDWQCNSIPFLLMNTSALFDLAHY